MPRFRFGLFDFDAASGTLSREGVPVRLQPQPARVLALLVERAGVIVSREELRERVWGSETFVDFERGLNFCIAQIRSALADTAGAPRYIETLPRRGYRFIAPVHVLDDHAGPAPLSDATLIGPPVAPLVPARPWILRPGAIGVALVAILLVAGALTVAAVWRQGPRHATRIAVVPFDNETGSPAYDEVARGVADATVAWLAAPVRAKTVRVVGKAAILRRPRDRRDLKVIGDELDVEYVVLGQVKRDQERVRVIAHLIRVSDQAHMWASTFDRPVFTLDVQSELAEAIASAVVARLRR
jgi:DNA-binding winged helix-turn-helix (wHTH) protein/TolB-like protein